MTRALMCIASMAMLVPAANAAEQRYDHNLERAAARIVAARMGEIRGGFSFAEKPKFVVAQNTPAMATASSNRATDRRDRGLVPAIEGSAGPSLN